jgi:hypothetical protein
MAAESRRRNATVDISSGSGLRGSAARSVGLGEATRMERLAVMGARPGSAKGLPLGPGRIGFHACPGAWIVVDHARQQVAARRC